MPTAGFSRIAVALLALVPWLLGSCTVYDHIFHPHRLGTPPMTAAAKAKYKAAEKARHKGLTLGGPTTDGKATATKPGEEAAPAANADAGASADGASAATPTPDAEPAKTADQKNADIANMLGHTYDKKNGLMKRSIWQRMEASSHQRHHYATKFQGHTDVAHDARKLVKYKKHPKVKGDPGTESADASAPDPDPTQPADAAPTAKPVAKAASKARPAARPALKPRAAVKPAPRPATKPKFDVAPATADADEPQLEERKAKKEKPAKVKKPKRDKNGNKLPKADPTQPEP